jgi:hypothetical protein
MKNTGSTFLFISLACFISCKKQDKDEQIRTTVYKAAGDITETLSEFKAALGNLNTAPGAVGGRREINWDGVSEEFVNKPLPNDFFNTPGGSVSASRQRGLVYSTGTFQVSNNHFADVNAAAAPELIAFSGDKAFANVSSKMWDIGFEMAGQTAAASVKGFGLVFSDVDVENSTSLEFFNGDQSLGSYFAPVPDAATKFSFLGVYFPDHTVTRIRVAHQGILSSGEKDITQGGTHDLIILDDFIYSEPVKTAE